MYNFNELINLALNSMEYEGLPMDSLYTFFTEMGVSDNVADRLIITIEDEIRLAA